MSKFRIVLSLFCLLIGCVEVRSRHELADASRPKPAPSAPVAPDTAALASGISWEAVPAAPDQYRIGLKFPVGVTGVSRWVEGSPAEMVSLAGFEGGSLMDAHFPGGTKLRYLFISARGSQGLTVQVPKDLVIQGVVTVPTAGVLKFPRVFWNRGARLITQGLDVTIEADTIFADGGIVETFPNGQRAADGIAGAGRVGRGGGKLIFRARQMSGKLEVFLRGEDGGHGAPGAMMPRARDGAVTHTVMTVCEQPPAGPAGENGRRGNPGFDGGNGGDAGSLLVDVANAEELELHHQMIPGIGGNGGAGGPGQLGGLGGLQRVDLPGQMCRFAFEINWKRGPDGTSGDPGAAGRSGKNGEPGTCLDRKAHAVCMF